MNNITKDGNTLLPTGYIQWRKDIEQLIDTAKLKTAISINRETNYREAGTNRLGKTGNCPIVKRSLFSFP